MRQYPMSNEQIIESIGKVAIAYENTPYASPLEASLAMEAIVNILEEEFYNGALNNNYK